MKDYNIILADPPWPYTARRMVQTLDKKTGTYHFMGIEDEYTTMTMADLCALPIQNIKAKDCVLYLWATGPKLAEAFQLITAWGFKYSTMAFVWDKKLSNPGFYSNSTVEYVLVAKKGKCPTRINSKTKQMLTLNRTTHSKKPEDIQDRIDAQWGPCEKIELFARRYRPGWDCVGNELNGTIQDFLAGKSIGRLR